MNEENNPDEVWFILYLECLLTRRGWKNSNRGILFKKVKYIYNYKIKKKY